jgi:hypothetical protein
MPEAGRNSTTPPSLMMLDEVIEWIAFRGQPSELPPPQDPVTGDETDQPHLRELQTGLRTYGHTNPN